MPNASFPDSTFSTDTARLLKITYHWRSVPMRLHHEFLKSVLRLVVVLPLASIGCRSNLSPDVTTGYG